MLKEIVIAFQSWEQARRFIQAKKISTGILWPGILYSILFLVGLVFFWNSSNEAVSWMSSKLGIENWLQQISSEWLSFFFVMSGMMMRLVLVQFYFSLFKYLLLIVGSPAFIFLSEKTEAILENKEFEFNFNEIKKDAKRAISLALRNAGWQSLYFLGLLLLSFIPFIGWITPLIAIFMEAYYFGVSMLDYSFARHNFTLKQSVNFSSRHKGLAIGNGVVFFAMHLLIWLAPAYAIIAATLSVHQVKNIDQA